MSVYGGINFKDNKEQFELYRLINQNDLPIVICEGDAGTGKNFITIATSLELQDNKKYSQIIYARNPIQLGADMGYLPGDVDDKYGPFMGPLYDNLINIARAKNKAEKCSMDRSGFKQQVEAMKRQIHTEPIAFFRGRSLEDAIIIVDECQNLDLTTLKAMLTRIGKYCKIILLGSMNQIDDPKQRRKEKCDFQKVIDKLKEQPYVGYVRLVKSMRSPICAEVDKLLGEIEEEDVSPKPQHQPKKQTLNVTWSDGTNEGAFDLKPRK